jgi:hypothetical protein
MPIGIILVTERDGRGEHLDFGTGRQTAQDLFPPHPFAFLRLRAAEGLEAGHSPHLN